MYVVFNLLTGYSDESMRFATDFEATEWIKVQDFPDDFMIRYEP